MSSQDHDNTWDIPALSAEDQKIIDAYVQVGQPVDRLPYSDAFRQLLQAMGDAPTDQRMYQVFQRLLMLRKKGRLPRLPQSPAEVF